ncbi:MAG: T9SS type A sorting domain-containing protein [Candidatus Symbiothrix sp.]|jgi:hypothetical protein|nr:T9SS type A sorting domain-containing protein [Candidatus Symbiothrix sp.]
MKTKSFYLVAIMLLVASYATAQDRNVSLNAITTWPCDEVAPNMGNNAIDGDANTYWESLADNFKKDIEIELDKVYEIHKVVVKWHNQCAARPWDVVFDLDGMYAGYGLTPNTSGNPNCIYSINHSDYTYCNTTENTVDADYPATGSPYNTKIDFPYRAGFVKFFFRGRNTVPDVTPHYEVSEFELWGTEIGGTDIKKLNIVGIKAYPNPVADVLNIQNESLIESVSVLDLNGKQLIKYPVNANSYVLSTSDWGKGIYLVKIVAEDGIQTKRIVK